MDASVSLKIVSSGIYLPDAFIESSMVVVVKVQVKIDINSRVRGGRGG